MGVDFEINTHQSSQQSNVSVTCVSEWRANPSGDRDSGDGLAFTFFDVTEYLCVSKSSVLYLLNNISMQYCFICIDKK